MASATLVPSCSSHSSSPLPTISNETSQFSASLSKSPLSYSKTPIFRSLTLVSKLGFASFSTWNGLSRNRFSISLKSLRFEKKRKCQGKGVFASLFGVGAPEALVIGVVALLVFGPKGLAEIAKNLGKTLKAFQPTIRELQEVSREFKSTLEKEIGLDELKNSPQTDTSNIPTLSSEPLSVVTPENSPALATDTAPVATTQDSQATATPLAAANEDSQATATPFAAANEDPQATTIPIAATIDSIQEVIGSEVGTVV